MLTNLPAHTNWLVLLLLLLRLACSPAYTDEEFGGPDANGTAMVGTSGARLQAWPSSVPLGLAFCEAALACC